MVQLAAHQHGKSRVKVARVWRDKEIHKFVEWAVDIMLESDMEHAYLTSDNTGMTATDTQKNTVYYIAKRMPSSASPEDFAVAIAKHFVNEYGKVGRAKVTVVESPWQRYSPDSKPHQHGFELAGAGCRTAFASYADGNLEVHGGLKDWKVLKTTQSGYEGYCQDNFTNLQPTTERMLASSVTSTWRYAGSTTDFDKKFDSIRRAMAEMFFGPPSKGVYSPSVQYTLFRMGKAAIEQVDGVESVYLQMPNVHYHPCNPVNSEAFDHDVYVATVEPHGNIEAVVTKDGMSAHTKL